MAVADINGDKKPDLIIADSGNNGFGGAVYLAVNMGSGTFHAPVSLYSGFYPVFGVGDVDQDGKLDLVAAVEAGEGESQVSWLPGNGDGSFRAPVAVTTSKNPNLALLLQDFDGDGYPDIVLGNEGQTTTFMFGNGDGTFSPKSPSSARRKRKTCIWRLGISTRGWEARSGGSGSDDFGIVEQRPADRGHHPNQPAGASVLRGQ